MNFFKNNKIICIVGTVLTVIIISLSVFTFYLLSSFHSSSPVDEDENILATEEKDESADEMLFVEIKGEVTFPDVYSMPKGSIIKDLITKAGGIKSNGSTSNINMSLALENEMVVVVYSQKELNKSEQKAGSSKKCQSSNYDISSCLQKKESIITSPSSKSSAAENTPVQEETEGKEETENKIININIASEKELSTLPGIGSAKAKAIISYRTTNGFFQSIEDIKKVSGIGDATFNKFKDRITV